MILVLMLYSITAHVLTARIVRDELVKRLAYTSSIVTSLVVFVVLLPRLLQ